MVRRIKRILAPKVLGLTAWLCRRNLLGARLKDKLWKFSQKYAAYFGVERSVDISNGMRMTVSSKPRIEQEIFLFGEWEPLFTRYLEDKTKTDGVFLDIGANIGYFSLLASEKFDEVHAIEASPSTYRRMRKMFSDNGLRNVHTHNIAVGDAEGHVDFFQGKEQSGLASVINDGRKVFEASVPIAPLEKILADVQWHRVRFIKIDVEGFEAPVLRSLFALREELNVGVEIFCEFDPERKDTWPEISRFLDSGFSASMMQGMYRRQDYTEKSLRSALKPIRSMPPSFCDILLRRAPTPELPA